MRNPLFTAVYDHALAATERAGLAEERGRLLADASGDVLEVGAGTGLNLSHYPAGVSRLVLTDPDRGMLKRLRRRVAATGVPAATVEAPAERLPFGAASFDEVVSTLVLCSVGERLVAGAEIHRVLRPGGRLRFIEHVAAGPHGPSALQRVAQPAQRLCAGGCRLDLSMAALLRATGFTVERIADWELPRMPPWVRPAVIGVATKPA